MENKTFYVFNFKKDISIYKYLNKLMMFLIRDKDFFIVNDYIFFSKNPVFFYNCFKRSYLNRQVIIDNLYGFTETYKKNGYQCNRYNGIYEIIEIKDIFSNIIIRLTLDDNMISYNPLYEEIALYLIEESFNNQLIPFEETKQKID